MKAVFCEKLGSPDDLVLRDVASPTPGPGEVKVALRARGVSYVDVLMIAGQYQVKRDLPFIPGGEAAGVVLETGSGVEHIKPGDRVLVPGGFAEETVVKTERVTPLPASVSFETAAAFRSSYHTAYYALQRGRLKAGEVLLVHGAAGGVGLAGSRRWQTAWRHCDCHRQHGRKTCRVSADGGGPCDQLYARLSRAGARTDPWPWGGCHL